MIVNSELTRGQVSSLVRLCSIISLLLLATAVALQFAPLERPPSPAELINATTRQSSSEADFFSSYSAMQGARDNPFELGQVQRAQVQFQIEERVPAEAPVAQQPQSAPPPPPQPDVDGLHLVGTMPGSHQAFALLRDDQSGLVQTFAQGEQVRNSVLTKVFDDRIELSLAEQTVELLLAQIADGNGPVIPSAVAPESAAPTSDTRSKPKGKPSLGVSGHMLAPSDMEQLGLTRGNGLLVTGVRRRDGLIETGDVIVAADGRQFRSTREFVALMGEKGVGTPVELTVLRKTERLIIMVMLL